MQVSSSKHCSKIISGYFGVRPSITFIDKKKLYIFSEPVCIQRKFCRVGNRTTFLSLVTVLTKLFQLPTEKYTTYLFSYLFLTDPHRSLEVLLDTAFFCVGGWTWVLRMCTSSNLCQNLIQNNTTRYRYLFFTHFALITRCYVSDQDLHTKEQ
jgi:hypothetical protein